MPRDRKENSFILCIRDHQRALARQEGSIQDNVRATTGRKWWFPGEDPRADVVGKNAGSVNDNPG